jgi:hypothetical protein
MPQDINVSESKQQFVFGLLWPLTFPSRWPFGAGIISRCILQNPPDEIAGFNVFMPTLAPKGKGTRKTPQTDLYKNEYNCLTQMMHRLGI